VHRGGQPWYYYTLLYSLYEQLVAIFAIGGLVWAFRRPSLITTFFAYWAVLAYGIYSWAGEKFSWLMIHPLLPMTLLASMFIVNVVRSGAVTRWVVLAVLAVLGVIQLHSLYEVNFVNGADPVEMMVYVQSAPDTPVVANNILALSNKTTNGPDMHVTIDTAETWPFAWYLRDMPNVAYPSATELKSNSYLTNPVVLVDQTDDPSVHAKLAKNYTRQFEILRWWFPEDYKTWTWGGFFHMAVSPNYWGVVTQWFIHRRPFGPKGSVNFYYYVKKGIAGPL
jgi:predicted membrane-bound mannosyltransferase